MKPLLLAVAVLALAAPAWGQTPPTPAPVAAAPAPPYGAPIGLETAQALIDRATAAAAARGFRMAFAIVEPSGALVAFGRMDDTQYGSIAVAQAKARSAALYRTATSVSEERLAGGRTALLALDGMVPVAEGVTIVMHKPMGYVSGQPEPNKLPAVRLVTDNNRVGDGVTPADEVSLPPIGRLDEDSRGLLLLSSDGVVAKAVIGPQSDLDKEYLVRVTGDITEKKLKILRHGLMLDGRQLKPAYVSRMESFRLKFILREGRNRQIRRMCEMVDLEVIDLIRVRIGPLKLDNLPEGKWRMLTAEERTELVG